MEREGKGEGRGREVRGRRGGEMRKGIVIGGMVIGLLMGCNNGGELEAQKRLGEIGRSAENVFYEFIGLIADTLGFRVTAETKKEQVGSYFSGLGEKIGKASKELEKVAKTSEVEGSRDESIGLAIRTAIEAAKTTLNKLKEHLDTLKGIGDGEKVGDAETSQKQGAPAAETELKNAHKALKGIVEIAHKAGVEKPEAGDTAVDKGADNSAGAKILATQTSAQPSPGDEGKAAAILATVSGKQILASIVNSKEDDPQIGSSGADGTTTAMSFAKGNSSGSTMAKNTAKAAAVAGGIVLRSLVKTGKLAAGASAGIGTHGGKEEVQGVGITAVNKLLGALEDIIKNTVKNVIGTAKQKIDEARAPKSEGQK